MCGSLQCVDRYMCGSLHVLIVTCVDRYMCGSLHVLIVTCVDHANNQA